MVKPHVVVLYGSWGVCRMCVDRISGKARHLHTSSDKSRSSKNDVRDGGIRTSTS